MSSADTQTKTTTKLAMPKMHKVVLLNDDFTPMEFVIQVLIELFSMSHTDSLALTERIHREGRGVAGTYTAEIADEKVRAVARASLQFGHPLKAISEPA